MQKKMKNTACNKNENPTPQGSKWPKETIIRYIIRALFLLIVFAWALVNLDAVLRFLGKVLALFTPFLIGGAIAFLINVVLRPLECCWNKTCKADPSCVPDSKHRTCPRNSVCRDVYDDSQPAGIRR